MAADALLSSLADPSEQAYVRARVARSLGVLKDPRAFGPLVAIQENDQAEENVRSAAVWALRDMGDGRVVAALVRVLDKATAPVVTLATTVEVLSTFKGDEVYRALVAVAKGPKHDGLVRGRAAMCVIEADLGRIEDSAILDAFRAPWSVALTPEGMSEEFNRKMAALRLVVKMA